MTLILRSDARASSHLGGSHGFNGPLDFVAMLDFSGSEYYRMSGGRRFDLSLSEAISVTRSSQGVVRRRDGSLAAVPQNTPRISYIDEYQRQGLLVESALTNFAQSGANGSTVTLPSAMDPVILSFSGGDASLSAAALTFVEQYTSNGRTCKRYSRTSGVINATLSVSGGAQDIQVVHSDYPGLLLGYGGSQAIETASLPPSLVSLISAGSFSIVQQVCMNPTGGVGIRSGQFIAVKSGSPQGGAYMRQSLSKVGNGTNTANTALDGGAANSSTVRATVIGTWRDVAVMGLTCQGLGDSVGVISYGQYSKASGLGGQFSTPANVYIGGETGLSSGAGSRLGGIITRVALYDRMLTDDEAWGVANSWR